MKEETRCRVAAIRASRPKCLLGRKCKDQLCTLHPDRGRIRNLSKLSKVDRGLAQRRKKSESTGPRKRGEHCTAYVGYWNGSFTEKFWIVNGKVSKNL